MKNKNWMHEAILHTRTGAHALHVRSAGTFLSRFRGLMLSKSLPADHGLLILGCPSVHTAFVLYAIDVVYLDARGTVLKCVRNLRPWRMSISSAGRDSERRRHVTAAHTLELAAGTIDRLDIRRDDRLEHRILIASASREPDGKNVTTVRHYPIGKINQRGATMVEFIVVGPLITLMGLAVLQYGLLFFAKNQINHAAFLAARAGSTHNANLSTVREALVRGLIPLYGGGRSNTELATAACKARDEVNGTNLCLAGDTPPGVTIELLNPTKESFDDWNSPALQNTVGGGRRVIPNGGQAFKDPSIIKANSGQNIQDANIMKLRVTYGYLPKVPLMAAVFKKYLQSFDSGADPTHTRLINSGRIPVVADVALQMQSDAIESNNPVSSPGMGNNGSPNDPGEPPEPPTNPPECATAGCSTEPTPTPADPGGGGTGGGAGCSGPTCDVCPAPMTRTISSDVLFDFDRSSLDDMSDKGRSELDKLIEDAKNYRIESITVAGYTDPLGSADYNKRLSLERAKTVRDYMKQHGFPDLDIKVEGRGATDLKKTLADCPGTGSNDPQQIQCLAEDRRVQIEAMVLPK
jgi:outer membrane protein OmpA-like peptidoglycan-associated protein/uncharacterized membrane protein (UPF0127 family)